MAEINATITLRIDVRDDKRGRGLAQILFRDGEGRHHDDVIVAAECSSVLGPDRSALENQNLLLSWNRRG